MLTKTHMNRACELSAAIINLDVSPINRGASYLTLTLKLFANEKAKL